MLKARDSQKYVILMYMILAIDIGGTKTLVAHLNKNKSIESSIKFKTPTTYDEFLVELESAKNQLGEVECEHGAVGIRGAVDRENGMFLYDSILEWRNVPLVADCAKMFGCDFLLENDSNLAGLSEAREVPDKRKVVYVTISTGIGTSLIVDGHINPSTADSEVGKWLFEKDGGYKIWEKFASGSALYEKHNRMAFEIPENDPVWEEVAENIAIGMVNICAAYTPDIIIMGGGMGGHLNKFQTLLENRMKELAHPILRICPVQEAVEPDFAVIYGAYHYAVDSRA